VTIGFLVVNSLVLIWCIFDVFVFHNILIGGIAGLLNIVALALNASNLHKF
jgi:hypothetical protein